MSLSDASEADLKLVREELKTDDLQEAIDKDRLTVTSQGICVIWPEEKDVKKANA